MDAQQFQRAFPPLPEKVPPSNPERRELLEIPRLWMSFFNDTLTDYLSGEPLPEAADFYDNIVTYTNWADDSLEYTARHLRKIDDPTVQSSTTSELNFHKLNRPVAALWYQLLYQTIPLDRDELTAIQVRLATEAAPDVSEMRSLNQTNTVNTSKRLHEHMGHLPEVDSLVVGLELMKDHPELIVLPAPSQFEQNPRSRGTSGKLKNSDLLLIDTEAQQVRGLQVKTVMASAAQTKRDGIMGQRGYNDYDNDYVTIIDSFNDLGNTTHDRRRRSGVMSLPGQISLGLLAEQPIKKNISSLPTPQFMKSRAIAREIMRGRRSFMPQAIKHIAERALQDLYREQGEQKRHQIV